MFQFVHVECYSLESPKKGKAGNHSVKSIVDEAVRNVNSVPHIISPEEPRYIYGKLLENLEGRCRAWSESMTNSTGRKTRKDALCLLAGVITAPAEIEPMAWRRLRDESVLWLRAKYGDRLQTVVEHVDEANPHVHFYVVPHDSERFEEIHDGKRAVAAKKGEVKGIQNKAYKQAMRGLLDDYSQKVGLPNGMLRYGPGRRRLTREAWRIEKEQAKSLVERNRHTEALIAGAERLIERSKEKAAIEVKRAVARGVAQGREQFLNQGFWGKLFKALTKLPSDNRMLRSKLNESLAMNQSLKLKARSYQSKLKEYAESLFKAHQKYESLKNDLESYGLLRARLESVEKELEVTQDQLRSSMYQASRNVALVEYYQELEDRKQVSPSIRNWKKSVVKADTPKFEY